MSNNEITYKALLSISPLKLEVVLKDLVPFIPKDVRLSTEDVYSRLKLMYENDEIWSKFVEDLDAYHWGREWESNFEINEDMKHDVTKGSWQRVVVHKPAEVPKASSNELTSTSNKTNKELVLDHLKEHGFKARYTYKYLADQLSITTNKVFSIRKQLEKDGLV